MEYNQKYGIIPQTIKKPIENNLLSLVASYRDLEDIVAEEMQGRTAAFPDNQLTCQKLRLSGDAPSAFLQPDQFRCPPADFWTGLTQWTDAVVIQVFLVFS